MSLQDDRVLTASEAAAETAEGGAASPGQHFKRSPTLLFGILAETDKDKQQRKLQQATLLNLKQAQPQHEPIAADLRSRNPGPPTPDLPANTHVTTRTGPAPNGPAMGTMPLTSATADMPGPKSSVISCTAAAVAAANEPVVATFCNARELFHSDGHEAVADPQQQQLRQQQQLEGSGLDEAGRVAAVAVVSGGGDGQGAVAAPTARLVADAAAAVHVPFAMCAQPGLLPPFTTATASSSVCPPPYAPSRDLLAEFTPRVILQELLGELFIPPERLTLKGIFGQGAFATVQSCSWEVGPRGPTLMVAVKSLKPEVLSDLEDLRRFLLEANLVRKLHHPNIVSIHGLGAHELSSLESLRNSAFVVMEGLQGGDLRMRLLKQMTSHSPTYSRLDALRWCTHIAAACAYLHETCHPMVIHRDLKPENVMLTGGPVHQSVAKITDFGLHKRARYSRTEDVLMAVESEWSSRGGSVYHGGFGGGSVRAAGGTVLGGGGRPDRSVYGGSVIDGSYNGKTSGAESTANNNINSGIQTTYGKRGTSARYHALATVGVAAAAAEAASVTAAMAVTSANGITGVGSKKMGLGPGQIAAVTAVVETVDAGGNTGPAVSFPPGDSLRSGSEAAAELELAAGGGKVTERERPYLLAYDKRYDTPPSYGVGGGSKWGSTTDLTALHDTALGAVADALAAAAADGGGNGQVPYGTTVISGGGSAHQPLGWMPPHTVPPVSLEESVHRKMLALMALESAGTTVCSAEGGGPAAVNVPTSGPSMNATAAAVVTMTEDAPFSVTEFVRAAAAVARLPPTDAATAAAAPVNPSALMLMRSMSLALQQEQPPVPPPPPPPFSASSAAGTTFTAEMNTATGSTGAVQLLPTPAMMRAVGRAAVMKTVPENNRMSMDVGAPSEAKTVGPADRVRAMAAAADLASLAESCNNGSAPAAASVVKLHHGETAQRGGEHGVAVSAAARMADATRQVGSLIYMAPELVTSGSYNEKIDVFSFAIIAYELFMGKLLAMKIANEYSLQLEQQGSGTAAAARGARAGPGGLPAGGTHSKEGEMEAGVMAYVMRRCQGAREPLPTWWPQTLRHLITRCWAQDPANRPSFSQIHRELRRMQHDGTLKDMDSRDPLKNVGCVCTIS